MKEITLLIFYAAIIFLAIAPKKGNCQNGENITKVDSIKNTLASYKNVDEKVDFLLSSIESIRGKDRSTAIDIAKMCSDLVKQSSSEIRKAKTLYWQIESVLEDSVGSESLLLVIEKLGKPLSLFEQEDNNLWEFRTLLLISQAYYYHYDDSIAWEFNNEAFKLIDQVKKEANTSEVLGDFYRIRANIVNYFPKYFLEEERKDSIQRYYSKAEEYYFNTEAYAKRSRLMLSQAVFFKNDHNYSKAKEYYDTVLAFDSTYNNGDLLGEIYQSYGNSLSLEALEYENYDLLYRSDSLYNLSIIHNPTDNSPLYYEIAVNTHNRALYFFAEDSLKYRELLQTASEQYRLAMEKGASEKKKYLVDKSFLAMSKICSDGGLELCEELMANQHTYYNQLFDDKDSLSKQLVIEKEALSNFKQEASNKSWRQWVTIIVLFFVTLYVLVILFYQRRDHKLLAERNKSRMQALRAQMNPHFISNALTSIDSLILQDRNDEASKYIINFGRLSRMVLESSVEPHIGFEEEIKILEDYLSIEKLRFGDRLTTHLEIDESLNLDMYMIPPLILQPFVENAIMHGIENKKDSNGGEIKIKIFDADENNIKCIIEDNGVGREAAKRIKKASKVSKKKSFGMDITNERIEALKESGDSKVTIRDLYNKNDKPEGTQVQILLPKISKSN